MTAETKAIISRDELMATAKRRFVEVWVAGLGTVRLRNLSAGESAKIEAATYADNKKKEGSGVAKWKARHVMASVVNADGQREFSDSDIDTVLSLDAKVIDVIYEAVEKHSGIGNAGSEDVEKNFETTRDDSSLSD